MNSLFSFRYRRGRTGSSDRVILRLDDEGVYLSVRLVGRYGFGFSYGPRYVKGIFVRGWQRG